MATWYRIGPQTKGSWAVTLTTVTLNPAVDLRGLVRFQRIFSACATLSSPQTGWDILLPVRIRIFDRSLPEVEKAAFTAHVQLLTKATLNVGRHLKISLHTMYRRIKRGSFGQLQAILHANFTWLTDLET